MVYLTGFTLSSQASFPVSNGAANTTYSGDQDAYVVQLNLLYAAPPVATTDWTPAPNQAHVPVITNKYPCNFP